MSITRFALLAFSLAAAPQLLTSQSMFPSDSAIRAILADRIDNQHQSVGIVVGLIEPSGRHVISYGAIEKGDARPLDGNTIFEIGSITKVFTSTILADMVRRGEVKLDDPISKYLPAGVGSPTRNGRAITLLDLATHSSGLPRMPTNFRPSDPGNPFADYTTAQMYEFLSSYQLPRDIGSQFEYSNYGVGLLGQLLARRAGVDYETLVRTRVLEPLHMANTWITVPADRATRFATGYDGRMNATRHWDVPTFAGAGALRSTANDMLTFVGANIGLVPSPLAPAMADMLRVSRPAGAPTQTIGLGWLTATTPGVARIVWHNGGTGGFRTFAAFDPDRRIGVVVLSNAATPAGVDDIGMHLLNERIPLAVAPKKATDTLTRTR